MGLSSRLSAARSGLFRSLGLMFISGFFATVAFDLWGQVVSPSLGFANLSPHGLAKSLLGAYGLPSGDFAGYFVHFYLVGLIGYPVGWLYVFRPVWVRVVPRGGWFSGAAVYGFGLWIFAIGGITYDRVRPTLEAGAHGVAVLSAICTAKNPERATARFRAAIDGAKTES